MLAGKTQRFWIEALQMIEHPEGGFFAPAFRTSAQVGGRSLASSIYYLLEKGRFSAFHRLRSAEIWNFFDGGPIRIYLLEPGGGLDVRVLGPDIGAGEFLQVGIEPGTWFAAELAGGGEYGLAGCVVAPGFDWEDFELADRVRLTKLYPAHRELIERLTGVPQEPL